MNGAYIRATVKAEIKRAKALGETVLRGAFIRDEIGWPNAKGMPEIKRAVWELEHPAVENHGPPKYRVKQRRRGR